MTATILVADDDRSIRTVLGQALTRSGYQVRTTGTAATLWRWVEDGEGDLVITDVVMPDENGLDLDVYYPRKDGRELPPATVNQVDARLSQDLLDRFVTAGASVVFVGYSVPLRGQAGVVVPYANHDNHMHVRIGAGGAVSGD